MQSKKDYDREQAEKARLFLNIIWWLISSFLFSSLFKPFVSIETYGLIFLTFIVLFMVADLTQNRQVRSYIRATFGFLYGLCGIAFIFIGIFITRGDSSVLLTSLGLGGLFLWLAHRNLKKYTSLLDKHPRSRLVSRYKNNHLYS
ncbi:MAG: hypothetical protein KAT83_04095 [Candidatus Aenigmarchaeota archaeon]|nr:hypothetical protein [Candidatus Aenigmarchaeota archaeon]